MTKGNRKLMRNVTLPTQAHLLKLPTRPTHASGEPWRSEASYVPTVSTELLMRQEAVDRGFREGHAAGLARGLEEGKVQAQAWLAQSERDLRAQVQRERDQLLARLGEEADLAEDLRRKEADALLSGIQAALGDRLLALEGEAALLAFEALSQVLMPRDERRTLVEDLVARACLRLRAQPTAVRLHPRDMAMLTGQDGEAALQQRHPGLALRADDRVSAGGCVLESLAGRLDARLDQQLALLVDAWRKVLEA